MKLLLCLRLYLGYIPLKQARGEIVTQTVKIVASPTRLIGGVALSFTERS